MPAKINIIGRRFGKLIVKADAPRRFFPGGGGSRQSLCLCDCGKEVVVLHANLSQGRTKSCGCGEQEARGKSTITHGKASQPIYKVWIGMIARCHKPYQGKAYEFYSGKGITVCDRWRRSFADFFSDMGDRPSPEHSIDRINTKGNYEPGNCRWATKLQQARNTRTNHFVTFNGETLCLAEWFERTGIPAPVIRKRIKRGWSVEDALTTPTKVNACKSPPKALKEEKPATAVG